jgi:hypothetical protein
MDSETLLIALAGLLVLLLAAGLARRFASGWRKDALSVGLVALALLTAFLLFFAAGTFVRKTRPQPALLERRLPDPLAGFYLAASPSFASNTESSPMR